MSEPVRRLGHQDLGKIMTTSTWMEVVEMEKKYLFIQHKIRGKISSLNSSRPISILGGTHFCLVGQSVFLHSCYLSDFMTRLSFIKFSILCDYFLTK